MRSTRVMSDAIYLSDAIAIHPDGWPKGYVALSGPLLH